MFDAAGTAGTDVASRFALIHLGFGIALLAASAIYLASKDRP